MQWTGKLIGGALGAFLGPVGIAVGAILGHQYDVKVAPRLPRLDSGPQFFRATFRVMGHVAKADGRVTEREIEAARGVMSGLRLNPAQVREAIALFGEGKRADFDLDAELLRLREACRSLPAILRVFVEIQLRAALSGNDMSGPVRQRMTRIAGQLGFSPLLLAQMEQILRGGRRGSPADNAASAELRLAAAYRQLEIEPAATDAELVKSYRRLMSRNHPDKLKANGLPESMLEHAKQRTQEIREAYEYLRERRGMG
ncbi:MAG TPA: co-chaperone DjlA [Steroidobacteraceae bacterium]|jgi:DnaJ like chaperone protein|nr:co-chaperone DjlA [Steroidobacteraceae bacterium]